MPDKSQPMRLAFTIYPGMCHYLKNSILTWRVGAKIGLNILSNNLYGEV
jgi:hypothetical protein